MPSPKKAFFILKFRGLVKKQGIQSNWCCLVQGER